MKLTVVASNRDRLKLDDNAGKWFLKSIQWQDYTDFELLIADSNSKNYEELKNYFESSKEKIPMRIVQHKMDLFSRSELNNVGIRNARGEFMACTDVDMLFDRNFLSTVMNVAQNNCLIDSRTMRWKQILVDKIYNGEIDPYNNIKSCRLGRILKRTSAGGFQCMHINDWNKINGFDERYRVWGSEDQDLLKRVQMAGIKTIWLGESRDSIMLFHQPHAKKDIKYDLEWQEKNKKFLNNITDYRANVNKGWGGKE